MSTKNKYLLKHKDVAIRNIMEGGEEALKAMYSDYRNEFLSWAKRNYSIPEDTALDIFQDAIIVFYKNVIKGKISHLESSIKSYLFGICKNMFMSHHSQKRKTVLVEDMNDPLLQNIDWTVQHKSALSENKELINGALNQLTDVCKKIIKLFYYQRFSMEAIKENMSYNSEEVARTSKKKCMRKLEVIVKERLNKN